METTRGCKIKDPNDARMSGYLEKKGKMRMVSSWKKYWFVLEGRLLLYYRSRIEYETLSPCKGTINLCPPCEVRPISASAGAFQISTRSTTFNLRAEDRTEQEKWMQALLAVLNAQHLSSPPTKMSHFRYSLDDLIPIGSCRQKLSRQNTLPHRQNATKETLLQRVQQLGGHSYGGSLGAITKLATEKQRKYSPKILKNKKISKLLDNKGNNKAAMYGTSSDVDPSSAPDISRLSSSSMDPGAKKMEELQHLYAMVDKRSSSSSSSVIDSKNAKSNRNSASVVLIENDMYTAPVKRKKNNSTGQTDGIDQNENSVIVNNDAYQSVNGRKSKHLEEINGKAKEIVVDNDGYQGVDVRRSSDDSIEGRYETVDEATRRSTDSDQLYEDPDQIKAMSSETCEDNRRHTYQYVEPMLPPRPAEERKHSLSTSDESTASQPREHKNQIFKLNLKRIKQLVHTTDKKEGSNNGKRRSMSFMMNKMLRRKQKDHTNDNKENEDDEDPVYDTVDYDIITKTSPVLYKHSSDEIIAVTLSELQKKLMEKKNKLEEILSANKLPSNAEQDEVEQYKYKVQEVNRISDTSSNNETGDPICPNLPPRESSFSREKRCSSPFHDVPKNNRPVVHLKAKSNCTILKEQLNNIDKILNDLEQEKNQRESQQDLSVKKLIEKFSEIENEGVILRKPKSRDSIDVYKDTQNIEKDQQEFNGNETVNHNQQHQQRHSDELNKLLEELSKVTCAPLLTPGVTISLINDNLTDDEWLSMVPIRTRRFSDPDYDVPRPHRSLQFLPPEDNEENKEEVLPATRFFGPVLTQIVTEPNNRSSVVENSMLYVSMAPDSLEPFQVQQSVKTYEKKDGVPISENDRSLTSYASQLLSKDTINEQHIIPINPPEEECYTKSQDVFVDSLEPFPEVSTAF